MKVIEYYIWFPAVHGFDVETFEFLVPAKFVLMAWSVYKKYRMRVIITRGMVGKLLIQKRR